MDGDNWTNTANWLSEAPLDEWHGVGTNSNGSVFHLRLTDNQLSGELPSGLGSLSYLIILGAKDSNLSGDIPVELGNLTYLAILELDGNQLSGEIPSELGRLSNLEYLSIRSSGQLTGCIPGGLRNVPNNNVDEVDLLFR